MSENLKETQEGGAYVLTLTGPLDSDLCDALTASVIRASADDGVRGIVLRGDAIGFDPNSPDLAALAEAFAKLTAAVETCSKPVIATLAGLVRNEGLDLALTAQARVAASGATLCMNAVDLGLIPGGGSTQRLPLLIGPEAALSLMLGGETWEVTDHRLAGLVQSVVSADADLAAIKLAVKPQSTKTKVEPNAAAYLDALTNARARLSNPSPAQADIIACVEAAQLLPLSHGLAFETARFVERSRDRISRLLRHAANAKAKAAADLDVPSDAQSDGAPAGKTVVVMGRSSETADLAAMALEQGHHVWIEAGSQAKGAAIDVLARKRLRPQYRDDPQIHDRLAIDLTGEQMESADLIFDIVELTPDPPVELQADAVWIVTSPDMPLVERAKEVGATGRCLRMRRLFRAGQLIELSAPPETEQGTIATARGALGARGHSVIVTDDRPGGILGALFSALSRASLVMLAAGQDAGAIENAARDLGLRQGPLQMIDVVGAGRSLAQMRRVYDHRDAGLGPLRLLSDRMSDLTEGDAKEARRALVFHAPSGQGFARDPDLAGWLAEWRSDHPDRVGTWPAIDPKAALHAALVAEAARLLQADMVQHVSDIDLVAETGLLMDARRGGPLIQADLDGLLGVARVLSALETLDPAVWARERLIDEMVKNGRRFF
ncbi:MAG: enoyl-CoA hydratase-related protein [Pseudomonadota bacterium]